MKTKLLLLILIVILIFSISFASEDKLSFVTSPNSYIVWNSNYLILTGNATVTYKKTTIVATDFFYDIKNNTFYITSEATFVENKDVWRSKNMAYDVDDDELFLFDVSGESKQINPKTKKYFKAYYFTNYLFGNQENNKRKFVSNSGYFTTCDPRKPNFLDYKIRASKIIIYPKDHLIAYNVVMYIGFVPVYYFPFYYFPLNGNAKQPLDFSYKMDKEDGISIHIGLNYNLGGKGKDGSVYYNYTQKNGTMMGIAQQYSLKDLLFNFKYDIKNSPSHSTSNWFQLSYAQNPFNLWKISLKFMTSNSSDTSVFNTGKIQKYLYILSMNQPFKYSIQLSSMQNLKYENPTDIPTSSINNITNQPTTTINDSQVLPKITFNYSGKHRDLSLESLSFLYENLKQISTTVTPNGSTTLTDKNNSTLSFKTSFSLLWNLSLGYRYSNKDNELYTKFYTGSATTTQTASSVENYFYIKHSSRLIDSYISYEDNKNNSIPYRLLSLKENLKYNLRNFSGNLSAAYGKTFTDNHYRLNFTLNNRTPFYSMRYQKTISDIPGLPNIDQITLNSDYRNKYLYTNLRTTYLKKDYKGYNPSYLSNSENINFYITANFLRNLSISSKINYDFIKKEAINPYVYSKLALGQTLFELRYYMNNDLSFYKLWYYSKLSFKDFLFKNSKLYFDFSTSLDSNYKFGQSKFYLKYNVSKIMALSGSVYYYPDKNIFDNFLISSSLFFIPGWDININASYANQQWNDVKFNFVEDLSCWNAFGTIEYNKTSSIWQFKQFTIGLYIKAFPKKPYKLDPITGQFEIGGF